MRCLLVEDDGIAARFIKRGLEHAGFAVEHASDGVRGLSLALGGTYDVAVVDIMLPGLNGFTLIEKLRAARIAVPVIILSAKGTVDDRVRGLQTGGDDYLVKPFAFPELLARIQALLRRAAPAPEEAATLSVADLFVDRIKHKVFRGNKEIELQPLEFSLLEYLLCNAGTVLSKTMIMEHVWHYNFDPQTNVVETAVCRLRDKIDRSFGTKLIHTMRGIGYVLEQKD